MTTNPLAFKTTMIRATSRASVKIKDSFYTFESTEERSINHEFLPKEQNEALQAIEAEWKALWDTVNAETDNQVNEIVEFFKNNR